MKSFKEYLEIIQESDYERITLEKFGMPVPESLYSRKINNLTDDQFKEVTKFIDHQLQHQTSDLTMRNLYLLIKQLKQSSKKVDPTRKSTLEKYSKEVLDKMVNLIRSESEKYRELSDFIEDKDY